jgi:hypothetical protein
MGKPPAGHGGDDRMNTVHLMMNTNRWIRDEGLRLEDTPSRGNFSKEPLHFFFIKPAVLGVFQEIRIYVLKAYFLPVYSKIRFQKITDLPLELF